MDHDQDRARRHVARIMLDALKDTDFALTGASALSEHGIISRPTRDVDLFTIGDEGQRVPDTLPTLRAALAEHDATLTTRREYPGYVEGKVTLGDYEIGFDLGADWRAYPAVQLDIGSVLDVRDSVASKTAALYSRSEARDYMDVAAIVRDGRWTCNDLMTMAENTDPGFDRAEFARLLDPNNPRFPHRDDFRDLGFDARTEDSMRTALLALRSAALDEDGDLEAFDAARIARAGRTPSPHAQHPNAPTTAPARPRDHAAHRNTPEQGHGR